MRKALEIRFQHEDIMEKLVKAGAEVSDQESDYILKLLEEKQFLNSFKSNEIMGEIEKKHAEILDKRPLPNLLESAELIDSFKEVKSPTMGKLYEEKKEIKIEKDNFFNRE